MPDSSVKATFVSHVGPEPASYLQASYLVGGRVLSFRVPIDGLDAVSLERASVQLSDEVAKAWAKS
jgi:hypothetical protein